MADPANAVFLSYAREDTAAAFRIADGLRAGGVEVWFDQSELRGGDAWDAKIKKQIQTCALFMPIISAQTQVRTEGYFRLEWLLAAERRKLMGRSKSFLIPVCIDDTIEGEADVPEAFLNVQWTRLPDGETKTPFVERVRCLLGGEARGLGREGREDGERERDRETNRPAANSRSIRKLLISGGAVVLLAIAMAVAFRPQAPPATVAQPPKAVAPAKSVAVLAFENLSRDQENEPFCDGISDELLNLLGKVNGLTVKGRTSAFSFKGQAMADTDIGQKLGVVYLVNGSIQKAGSQVRIAARLVQAADGVVVWSETFTDELKDIFDLQDRIAGQIAEKLQLKLTTAPRVAKSVNPEAHRLVLEGRYYSSLRTTEGLARAEAAFGEAIARDPEFSLAHAGLAEVCIMRANYATQDGASTGEVLADMKRARIEAQRAIAMDPKIPEAYAALGYCEFMDARYEEATRQFEKALRLNPNHSTTYAWLAMLQLSQGRLGDALRNLEKTVELDPLWPVSLAHYADVLAYARRPAAAFPLAERAVSLRQGVFIPALGVRAKVLAFLGRNDEAVETARLIRKHLNQYPRRGADDAALWVLHRAGLEAEASAYLEEILKTLEISSHQRGFALGAVGRFDEALPFLEKTPPGVRRRLNWDPMWDPWREDPRFQQLMVKLGCTAEYQTAREELARLVKESGAKK